MMSGGQEEKNGDEESLSTLGISCLLSEQSLFQCPRLCRDNTFVDASSAVAVADTSDALLLLMLLVLDDETLEQQVPIGRQVLRALEPLGIGTSTQEGRERRKVLVDEVRSCLLQPSFWESALKEHKGKVMHDFRNVKRSKQKPLEDGLKEWVDSRSGTGLPLCYPSMLQMMYSGGARDHVLVCRWMHAAIIQHTVILKSCSMLPPLSRELPLPSSSRFVGGASRDALVMMEVPNPLQRTHTMYADWDVPEALQRSQFFGSMALLERVQFIRRMALKIPAVVCIMLRDMGCIKSSQDEEEIFVLVKEGTRELDSSVSSSSALLNGGHHAEKNWKISFHFVFQVLASHVQFKCVYELLFRFMEMHLSKDLCFLQKLVGDKDYEMHVRHSAAATAGSDDSSNLEFLAMHRLLQAYQEHSTTSEAGDDGCRGEIYSAEGGYTQAFIAQASAALVGLDPTPRKNARQGLACLGSRKKVNYPGSRLVGMMKVNLRAASVSWLADADGVYGDGRSHPLLALVEGSIVMPGPRCIGMTNIREWHLRSGSGGGDGEDCGSGSSSHPQTSFPPCPSSSQEETLQGIMHRVEMAEAVALRHVCMMCWGTAAACGKKNRCSSLATKRTISTHRSSSSTSAKNSFHGESSAPAWFVQILDAMYSHQGSRTDSRVGVVPGDGFRHYFQSAHTNVPYIQAPSACAGCEKECSMVQISKTDMCMCALALARVPFEGYKCHKSNGVVFCFFRDRIFVSCMDSECRASFELNGKSFFAASRVLEEDVLLGSSTPAVSSIELGFSDSSTCSSTSTMYSMNNPQVLSMLSPTQTRMLSEMKERGVSPSSSDEACFSRVSWRNMFTSNKGRSTWVELDAGIVRSYAVWRNSGRGVQVGDNAFDDACKQKKGIDAAIQQDSKPCAAPAPEEGGRRIRTDGFRTFMSGYRVMRQGHEQDQSSMAIGDNSGRKRKAFLSLSSFCCSPCGGASGTAAAGSRRSTAASSPSSSSLHVIIHNTNEEDEQSSLKHQHHVNRKRRSYFFNPHALKK